MSPVSAGNTEIVVCKTPTAWGYWTYVLRCIPWFLRGFHAINGFRSPDTL